MTANALPTVAAGVILALAGAVSAAEPHTAESVEKFRNAIGGKAKVPVGKLVVVNDYTPGQNGRVTIEVVPSYSPGKDIGHFPVDGGVTTRLMYDRKELVVGTDWGVRVIFGNGVRSEVWMLNDVARVVGDTIVVRATDVYNAK